MRYEAQITILIEQKDEAESIFLAVDMDNLDLPEGLECTGEQTEENSMFFKISTNKSIPTLRATVDDLLKSAETAYKVLRILD